MRLYAEMWAFGKGELRAIDVPESEIKALKPSWGDHAALEAAFIYGQNEVQPRELPSVSVGDVIRYAGKRYRVKSAGFVEIRPDPDRVALAAEVGVGR